MDNKAFIKAVQNLTQNLKIIVTDVKKQEALVVASGDNLSLAIGRKGQNVRLAARLTHFKIDIKSHEEAAEMGIVFKGNKFENTKDSFTNLCGDKRKVTKERTNQNCSV